MSTLRLGKWFLFQNFMGLVAEYMVKANIATAIIVLSAVFMCFMWAFLGVCKMGVLQCYIYYVSYRIPIPS